MCQMCNLVCLFLLQMQTELEKNISKELDYGETLLQQNVYMYFM